ncbi:MAG TPA: OmpH family outer membrane protein [Acetobacteraceae bacterium]
MDKLRLSLIGALAALAIAAQPLAAAAQTAPQGQTGSQNPGWFVPGTPHPPAATRAAVPGPADDVPGAEVAPQQIHVDLPPPPKIPPIPKGPPTPAAIVGIISTPELLHASTAYQQAIKELNDRRKKLNDDAQHEAVVLREQHASLEAAQAKLTPEQRHQRELAEQTRSDEFRRKYTERARIIQEQAQYAEAQIDRTLNQIIGEIAQARGINIVLNSAQLGYATPEFDLTPEVADFLNKALPTVIIPPDGVSPLQIGPAKADGGKPAAKAPVKH